MTATARLKRWISELSRRKVLRVAAFYAAGAWLCVEVLTTLLPVFGAEPVTTRFAVIVVLAGFPIALILAWYFNITPDRVEHAELPDDDTSSQRQFVDLPRQRTRFVGRLTEVANVSKLLRGGHRVITLTGPGGIGKTRLAIAAASQARDAFPAGVTFVSLASVMNSQLVIPAIAQALNVREVEGRTLRDGTCALIRDSPYLLVLDNFEQVIDAAGDLSALLDACARLTLLVTSRAPLRLTDEVEVPVPTLTDNDAIELFIDRARAVRPELDIGNEERKIIADICEKLDALPLAIELAAARTRTLTPAELLPRLNQTLDLLSSGARDVPDRHRTVRATIDWSYSLLTLGEQQLLRRLSVFSGGFSIEAVESVCYDGQATTALDDVTTLVESSLVRRGNRMPFTLLNAIREYCLIKLAEAGEVDRYTEKHARYYVGLAQEADLAIRDRRQLQWTKRVVAETSNFTAALAYLTDRARAGSSDAAEAAMLLCGGLWFHWHIQGAHSSVVERISSLLELPAAQQRTIGRLRALRAAGVSVWSMGDFARAYTLIRESADIARDLDARSDLVFSCFPLGMTALTQGNVPEAKSTLEEGVALARDLGEKWGLAWNACFLGIVCAATGDTQQAEALFTESSRLCREIGDVEGLGWSVGGLADIARAAGLYDSARQLYQEARDAYDQLNDRVNVARMLEGIGATELASNHPEAAQCAFTDALDVYRGLGSRRGMGLATLGLAATAAANQDYDLALALARDARSMHADGGISYTVEVAPEIRTLLDSAALVGEN